MHAVDGVSTFFAQEDGKIITGTSQDCTPILEDVKERHNQGQFGSSEMKHAARIPNVAIELYCNTNGIEYAEWVSNPVHIKRMLNDPELSAFRIWPGRV